MELRGLRVKLFGKGEQQLNLSWSMKQRSAFTITKMQLQVEVPFQEVWEKRSSSYVSSPGAFFNGTVRSLRAQLRKQPAADDDFYLGMYLQWGSCCQPVGVHCYFEALGVKESDTAKKTLAVVICTDGDDWGHSDIVVDNYSSLEDATKKLGRFIHPDGKLHLRGTVTAVFL